MPPSKTNVMMTMTTMMMMAAVLHFPTYYGLVVV